MQHRFGPEAVSQTLVDIWDDPCPFGGLAVVFGGDFICIVEEGKDEGRNRVRTGSRV